MSSIGSPILTSLLQTAQAQQVLSKARDRERAATDQTRRFQDILDLKAAGVEEIEAIRDLPADDSEHAEPERQAAEESDKDNDQKEQTDDDPDRTSLDITA